LEKADKFELGGDPEVQIIISREAVSHPGLRRQAICFGCHIILKIKRMI